MKVEYRIKMLELDHSYWLAHANRYSHNPNDAYLFDYAVGRCAHIRQELEEEYKVASMDTRERVSCDESKRID